MRTRKNAAANEFMDSLDHDQDYENDVIARAAVRRRRGNPPAHVDPDLAWLTDYDRHHVPGTGAWEFACKHCGEIFTGMREDTVRCKVQSHLARSCQAPRGSRTADYPAEPPF